MTRIQYNYRRKLIKLHKETIKKSKTLKRKWKSLHGDYGNCRAALEVWDDLTRSRVAVEGWMVAINAFDACLAGMRKEPRFKLCSKKHRHVAGRLCTR